MKNRYLNNPNNERNKRQLALMAALLLVIPSSRKDRGVNPDRQYPEPTQTNFPLKGAKVTLPAERNYDLASHELMALHTC